MSVESDLVTLIQSTLGIQRVYHLTVFQALTASDIYPCVVYEMQDDVAFDQLDAGNSGWFTAFYNVYLLTADGAQLRAWAILLTETSGEYGDGWRQWNNDTEQYDQPLELNERGILQTLLLCSIIRKGK